MHLSRRGEFGQEPPRVWPKGRSGGALPRFPLRIEVGWILNAPDGEWVNGGHNQRHEKTNEAGRRKKKMKESKKKKKPGETATKRKMWA